jgi:hypothetical protein
MSKSAEELLALRFGGTTVAENLKRAVKSGKLIEDEDGTLGLPQKRRRSGNWAGVRHGPLLRCRFLMEFLFEQAYAKSAVPHGCSACYKVKVSLRTLRELVAAWGIGKRIACQSKWGVDIDNPHSQDIYAGVFYTQGLDMARAIYKLARAAFDSDPKLGPQVRMVIRRGCSDYEAALGPADRYEFTPEMAELEAYLNTRFSKSKAAGLKPVPMAKWIETAFRIGDDTYLDFTGGKPPTPAQLSNDTPLDLTSRERTYLVRMSYEP